MAYHMFIPKGNSGEMLLDYYLGSASTINLYWESVGRELHLPKISSMTEMADYEAGFMLEGGQLLEFKNELIQLEGFWKNNVSDVGVPESFLRDMARIIQAIDVAIQTGERLYIA